MIKPFISSSIWGAVQTVPDIINFFFSLSFSTLFSRTPCQILLQGTVAIRLTQTPAPYLLETEVDSEAILSENAQSIILLSLRSVVGLNDNSVYGDVEPPRKHPTLSPQSTGRSETSTHIKTVHPVS